jgi:hypothetical protein
LAKDPAFLFYDGDAAIDVSHMNRLERGAYFDLIQAQRKFRGYTVEQARKILGRDFDEVWPALELILAKDELGLFYIEWVRDSMEKRKQYSEKQRVRIQEYWDKKKAEKPVPTLYHGITTDIPYVNENVIVIKNTCIIDINQELPKATLEAVERNQYTMTKSKNTDFIKESWITFLHERAAEPENQQKINYPDLSSLTKYFVNWMRSKFPPKEIGNGFNPLRDETQEKIKNYKRYDQ